MTPNAKEIISFRLRQGEKPRPDDKFLIRSTVIDNPLSISPKDFWADLKKTNSAQVQKIFISVVDLNDNLEDFMTKPSMSNKYQEPSSKIAANLSNNKISSHVETEVEEKGINSSTMLNDPDSNVDDAEPQTKIPPVDLRASIEAFVHLANVARDARNVKAEVEALNKIANMWALENEHANAAVWYELQFPLVDDDQRLKLEKLIAKHITLGEVTEFQMLCAREEAAFA